MGELVAPSGLSPREGLAKNSQTKIYPVQNWSVKKPIGAFLQTTAPVLDKIYGLMGG